MAKIGIKKALVVMGVIVLGAGVFFAVDAVSDDFNVVFYPDSSAEQPAPDLDPTPTPDPAPSPQPGLTQLAAPEMTYDWANNILTWEEVENASGYLLNVNGVEEVTTQTQAVLEIGQNEQYEIALKALGDGEKYSDSAISTVSGVRQDLDQMYYNQIEDNIYRFFEDYLFSNRFKVQIQDILNIDLQDNIFSVLLKANNAESANTYYRTFNFDVSDYKDYADIQISLKELAEVSNFIKDYDEFVSGVAHASEAYNFGDDLYYKLVCENLLQGELKNYIDNGYTLTKLYSEPNMGTSEPESFVVDSCIKLQKGNDIKVVTIQNKISQKYNPSFAFKGYVNAYINGTAEDVVIEETSFTEASAVSSLWQAADEKYGGQTGNTAS